MDMLKITRCKRLALIGIVLMAIGSFLSCLASGLSAQLGSGLLLGGMALSTYGFVYWRP